MKKLGVVGLAFLITMSIIGLIIISTRRVVIPGAVAFRISATCELVHYSPPLQPFTTMTIDCPGKDSVRIWPLPKIDPWFEDWWEEKPSPDNLEA